MEIYNVVQVLDTVLKSIQLGNIPKATQEIESVLHILNMETAKRQGKLFQPIHIPQMTETELKNPLLQRDFELANKLNEVIMFLNKRFTPPQ